MKEKLKFALWSIPKGYKLFLAVQKVKNKLNDEFLKLKSKLLFSFLKNEKFFKIVIPNYFFIENINICNANCIFCAYPNLKKQLNYKILNLTSFIKIVDKLINDLHIKTLWLTPIIGDVFLDKELFQKLDYLISKGIDIKLYTNGILLDKNNFKIAYYPISELHISLADIDPNIEMKVFGVNYHLAYKKITNLIKLISLVSYRKRNHKPTIRKIYLEFRPSRDPFYILRNNTFKKLKESFVEINFIFQYDNWGGIIDENMLEGIMELRKEKDIPRIPCYNIVNMPMVLSNGRIRLCACRINSVNYEEDELVLPDKIFEIVDLRSYLEIHMKRIIQLFLNGNPPKICKNCTFYRPLF